MKKLDLVNPINVINVEPVGTENIKDNYAFIVKLTTKESVLMRYNPLATIKQFIAVKWCIISTVDDSDICVSECIEYIDYYGTRTLNVLDDVMEHYDINEIFINKDEAEIRLPDYIKEQRRSKKRNG